MFAEGNPSGVLDIYTPKQFRTVPFGVSGAQRIGSNRIAFCERNTKRIAKKMKKTKTIAKTLSVHSYVIWSFCPLLLPFVKFTSLLQRNPNGNPQDTHKM